MALDLVYPFCDILMPWTFRDFLDGHGRNVITPWLDELPPKAKAKINARLRHLAIDDHWPHPFVKKLGGYDVYEITVQHFGIQYRPLGFYGPQRAEFTLLLGAIEQGDRIRPPAAFDTAAERRKLVLAGTN